jgi:hypothetical protein
MDEPVVLVGLHTCSDICTAQNSDRGDGEGPNLDFPSHILSKGDKGEHGHN